MYLSHIRCLSRHDRRTAAHCARRLLGNPEKKARAHPRLGPGGAWPSLAIRTCCRTTVRTSREVLSRCRVDVWGVQLRINPIYPVKEQDDLAGLGADIGDHLLDHRAEDPFLQLRPRRRRPGASTRASVLHGRSALPTSQNPRLRLSHKLGSTSLPAGDVVWTASRLARGRQRKSSGTVLTFLLGTRAPGAHAGSLRSRFRRGTEMPLRHRAQSIASADGSIRALWRTIPAAAPSSSNSSLVPSASIARRIDARLLAVGVLCPLSKSWKLLSETSARFASSPCDQPNHLPAARLCSGAYPLGH